MKLNGATSYQTGNQNVLHLITFATIDWIDVLPIDELFISF